jgi:hypothetical protein
MNRAELTKLVTAGSGLSVAISLYIMFGDHNWFGDRAPLQLNVAELAETPTGPQVLERFKTLALRCQVEPSPLGQQACWSQIGSFNGIPAKHVAFYFDGQQNLTAWKLTADASQYPALRAHFEQSFGAAAPAAKGAPFLTQTAGRGLLALDAQAPSEGETSTLWLFDPALVAGFRR